MNRQPRWDAARLRDESARSFRTHRTLVGFNNAVMALSVLDEVTIEVVRLRCARSHDCRLCCATRSQASIQAGVDDTTTDKIDFYESSDLDERLKVALRITDAFIVHPGDLDADLRDQAHAYFSDVELAALCLYIVKFSTQKIGVALGTDGTDSVPLDEHGHTYVSYHPDGSLAGFAATAQP